MAEAGDVACSENLNFSLVGENHMTDSEVSNTNKSPGCVLCGTAIAESDANGLGKLDIFGRLSPAFDIIVINKLASVTGCSTAELCSRGDQICPGCHGRLLKLHTMETSVEQERALISDLYRRSSAPRPTPSASDPRAAAPPTPGASLLLVNDMEVRLQDDQVTAVPLTNTRRRQLLRQARSAERRFQCKVCDKRFRAFSHRVEHMLIHVNEKPWACDLCPMTFRTKSARTAHQRVHAPSEGQFSCSSCDRQLSDAASLRAHMRTHEQEKPFTCGTCNHKFARRKDCVVHERQHTGERPHACTDCPKTFVARSRLNRHLQLHRDKQFTCGCGRAFRRRYELQRHGRTCGQPAAAAEAAEAEAAPAGVETTETTDPVAAGQPTGQTAALSYLPLVLSEASTLYYQVVTPGTAMAAVAGAAPLPAAEGAGEAAVQPAAPQEQHPQLPVVTY